MDLIEVDIVGPQPSKALLDLLDNVSSGVAGQVWAFRDALGNLGRNDRLITPTLQRSSDELFGQPFTIAVGGVDQVDAYVEGTVDDLGRPSARMWNGGWSLWPKLSVPSPISETWRPESPSLRYLIRLLPQALSSCSYSSPCTLFNLRRTALGALPGHAGQRGLRRTPTTPGPKLPVGEPTLPECQGRVPPEDSSVQSKHSVGLVQRVNHARRRRWWPPLWAGHPK